MGLDGQKLSLRRSINKFLKSAKSSRTTSLADLSENAGAMTVHDEQDGTLTNQTKSKFKLWKIGFFQVLGISSKVYFVKN